MFEKSALFWVRIGVERGIGDSENVILILCHRGGSGAKGGRAVNFAGGEGPAPVG